MKLVDEKGGVYSEVISELVELTGKSWCDLSKSERILNQLIQIMNSQDSTHYETKAIIMRKYAQQVRTVIKSALLQSKNDERKFLGLIRDVTKLSQFMNDEIGLSVDVLIGIIDKGVREFSWKSKAKRNVDYVKKSLNYNIATMIGYLANIGFTDKGSSKDLQALFEKIRETAVMLIENDALESLTLNNLIEFAAKIKLNATIYDHKNDHFLMQVLNAWEAKRDKSVPVDAHAARGLLYFLNFVNKENLELAQNFVKETYLGSAEIVQSLVDSKSSPRKANSSETKANAALEKAFKNNPQTKNQKVQITKEEFFLGWQVDLVARVEQPKCILLVEIDGPHHFMAESLNTADRVRTPYDQFRHEVIECYVKYKYPDYAVRVLRINSDDCANLQSLAKIMTPEVKALISEGAKKQEALKAVDWSDPAIVASGKVLAQNPSQDRKPIVNPKVKSFVPNDQRKPFVLPFPSEEEPVDVQRLPNGYVPANGVKPFHPGFFGGPVPIQAVYPHYPVILVEPTVNYNGYQAPRQFSGGNGKK